MKKTLLSIACLFGSLITNAQTPAASLNFDGIDDYVSINSTSLLSMTNAITIEAWVKTTESPTVEQYITSKSDNSFYMALNVGGNVGKASFYINGVSSSWLFSNASNITDNNWHHVAATYDGTTIKIYIDGLFDNSAAATGTIQTGGNNVDFGCRNNNQFLQGSIDEARIWNVARTQCEINSYVNCEIPGAMTGLVANYHFNQGFDALDNTAETSLIDASGNSNTGTLTNLTLTGTTSNWIAPGAVVSGFSTPTVCPAASALNFDGVNDYVSIDYAVATTEITHEFWFNTTVAGQGLFSITNGNPSPSGYDRQVFLTSGNINARIWQGGPVEVITSSGTNYADGNWHHVAHVIGASVGGQKLYIDGALKASGTFTSSSFNDNSKILLGYDAESSNQYFTGSMDEVRIWNTARTQCEINTYMNAEIPTSAIGLVANYHFNQGYDAFNNTSETSLMDASGNLNNGTITNLTLNGTTSNWIAPGAVVNGFSTPTVCPVASALNFDGADDIVSIPSSISANNLGLSAFTLESWVYPNSASGAHSIIRKSGDYNLYLNNGNLCAEVWPLGTSDPTWKFFTGVGGPALNQWSHVSFTWNGTTGTLYVNGSEISSTIVNGSVPVSENLCLGASSVFGNHLNGSLDETRIWNAARTQCEINTYMNCEIPASATGLVANYHFNQGYDAFNNSVETSLMDASGNLNDGTLTNFNLNGTTSNWIAPGGVVNGFSTSTVCPVAAALDLDGNDDFLLMPDATINDLSSGTIETWVYLDLNTEEVICAKQHNFVGSYAILAIGISGAPGQISFQAKNGSVINSNIYLSTGQWYHIAATFNGSGANLYVNGVLDATMSGNFTVPDDLSTDGTSIGAWLGDGGGKNLDGQVDEFRVWNLERTQCEIYTYMNAEIPASATGLVANYHFNQGYDAFNNSSETSLMDASGNSNTGTLTNFNLNGTTSNWIAPGGVVNGYTISLAPPTILVNSGAICSGNSFTITPSGADTYIYSGGSDVVMPTGDATYTVTGTNTLTTCSNDAVSTVTVNELPTITVNSGAICSGNSFTITPSGADTYIFSGVTDVVMPTGDATYTVTGTNTLTTCSNDAVITVTVNELPTITVNNGTICAGQSFTITPSGADTYTYSNGSDVVMPTGDATYSVSGTDANGCVSNVDAVSSITVNELPTITVNNGTICAGQSFTIIPSGADTYTYSGGSDVVMPTGDATYSVSGTDANGCVSNVDAISTLSVNALPSLMAMTNNTLLCAGETATLSVTGSATTYTWSTTETTMDIAVSPTATAIYTVEGTDANGCVNSTTISQDVSLCTGVVTLNGTDALINVYPNPNNGLFVIDLNTNSQVSITNALGQIVFNETLSTGKQNLNIQNQADGIYFVKITQQDKQHIIKLIKK